MTKRSIINRIEYESNIIEYGDDYIIYKDNGEYQGTIMKKENGDDIRHGYGLMKYSDGRFYDGGFKNDMREGLGKMVFPNGNVFEGEFKNNKNDGKLKIIDKYGKIIFDGLIKDDELTGYLIEKHENGWEYEGYIINNLKEGKGKFKFINGDIYEGEFKNDKFHGYGKFICKESYDNGDVFEEIYEGYWENDKKHGKGELKINGYWSEDNINSQSENTKRELFEEKIAKKYYRDCKCNYSNNSDPRYQMMFPDDEVYTFY